MPRVAPYQIDNLQAVRVDQHTPGRITVSECGGGYRLADPREKDPYYATIGVAIQRHPHPTLGVGGISDDTAKANAMLWAAAPDLLDAAKQVVEALACDAGGVHRCDCNASTAALRLLRAAIDKAEGK